MIILAFASNINKTVSNCGNRVFTLAKIRRYISEGIATTVYKTMIMSKLNYGGVLCVSARKSDLDKLQKLQNRALRICCSANRYTSNLTLHNRTNVLPLFLRRKLEIYQIMFKRMYVAENVSDPDPDKRVTRYNMARPPTFDVPKSAKFLNTITYVAPALWASLPTECKTILDSGKFNVEIRKLIRNELNYIDNVYA